MLELSPDRLLSLAEVSQHCKLSKAAVYTGIRAGAFPAPVKIGKSSRWLLGEVQAFIAARAAARPTARIASN